MFVNNLHKDVHKNLLRSLWLLSSTHINLVYISDIFQKYSEMNFLYILISIILTPYLGILGSLLVAIMLCPHRYREQFTAALWSICVNMVYACKRCTASTVSKECVLLKSHLWYIISIVQWYHCRYSCPAVRKSPNSHLQLCQKAHISHSNIEYQVQEPLANNLSILAWGEEDVLQLIKLLTYLSRTQCTVLQGNYCWFERLHHPHVHFCPSWTCWW